ncbi:hypothetical protein P4O66_014669 [Electrophorus voltai]|uniref:protein-tyrosine-phosphatase n=1 Tax=Electrophorus voltai TaxID=2609070 RepID=A0AAD9DPW1_9TELE|nr:hypothetical protein P4O66_014669 [Electrophorus voltai]
MTPSMAPCPRRGAPPAGRLALPSTRPFLLALLISSLPAACHAQAPPRFTKIPRDQTGVSGGVVSFVCQATGDPKPLVNWNKKGKKVNSQRIETIEFDEGAGAVLRIQPLRAPRDENVYECVARNSEGEIAITSKLSIIREDLLPFGFPSIDMGPQLKVVERTRTATMLCAASGIPDPEISWFKDFLPVEPGLSHGRIKQLRSGALNQTFADLWAFRRPRYCCEYGKQQSIMEKKAGRRAAPIGAASEHAYYAPVALPCQAPHFVAEGSFCMTEMTRALQIERSEETDQGKYECVASNSQGVRYSSPANLYVRVRRVPPRFTILPSSHEIMPGGSVNITCVAVGSPMPYVKWMLNAEDLTPEDEMPVGRNVLELNGVRESANYTCVAMSSLGIIEAVAQVIVKCRQDPSAEPVVWLAIDRAMRAPLPRAPGTPIVTETTATSVTITWDSGNPDPVSYYIIQYRAKSPDSKFETVDGITTTRYSIGGLYPNTEYEIRVSAFNTIGQGPSSNKVEARTGEQAPASPPRNVQAQIISQSTVIVRWEEPEEPNGQIKGYRVYYTMDPSQLMSSWQIHNVQDSMITTIQNLISSETYTIRVLAFTSVGDGPFSDPVHVKVLPGVPGQPGKFRVGRVRDTSVELIWDPPHSKEPIKSYELIYKAAKYSAQEKKSFEPRSSYMVEGLRANTEYTFILAAISSKGIGAFTNEITQRTAQASMFHQQFTIALLISTNVWAGTVEGSPIRTAASFWFPCRQEDGVVVCMCNVVQVWQGMALEPRPLSALSPPCPCPLLPLSPPSTRPLPRCGGIRQLHKGDHFHDFLPPNPSDRPCEILDLDLSVMKGTEADVPRNFSVNLATKTSVLLTWDFPESSSPCRFTVEYNRQKLEVDARLRRAVIPNLLPDTSYDFKITSPEGNVGGLRHRIHAKTSPPIVINRPEIDHSRDTETTVTIILPSLDTRTLVRNIYVVVVPLKKGRGLTRHLKSPDEMDLEELLKDISQKQRDPRQRQVDLRRAYITARFTPSTLPAFFTLGDQLDYGGFDNRALEPGQEYVFFILAELNSTTGKMFVASPYTDPVIAPVSDPQPLDAGDGLIWVVGPVLAVVFIICIVIAILLYKNKRKDSEPGTKCLLNNAEMIAHHPTDPVEMRRINFQTPGTQQRAYIATQGPLAETTEDFWRMLWEHNSTIVVMLTKLREMGREKCHQYWPAERSARYQYFVVDPMAEYNMPQYILREFKVTDARDGQSRTVRQFQFTDWPEQGVPKSGEGFIDFIGQVHKTKEQFGQDGPITVHCSAGVGRTGVFITLSIVLERMRYEGAVDIFQTVKMLRTQRPAMVQTEEEYQFCYQAALEYLGSFDHYAT